MESILKRAPALTAEVLDNLPAKEIKEKRGPFGKVFALEGGQFQAITYAKPVHYRDAATGAWEEIDNTFMADVYEGRPCLRTRAGETLAVCAASGPRPFLTLRDASGHSLSYGLEGAAEIFPVSDAAGREADEADPRKAAPALALRERVLEKREGAARYIDIFPNVDMVCAVTPGGIKDTVFFGSPDSARELTFIFDTRGGEMAVDAERNTITVSDATGETLFTLPMPFLLDTKQNHGSVEVTLSKEDGLWLIRSRCANSQAS